MLDALGLAPREQHCYEQLVAHPNLTAQELADRLELSVATVQGDLERLDARGLVSGTVDREAFVQRFRQLQQRAGEEVAVLNKPPYVTQFSEQEGTERRLLASGVVVRSIYERPDLEEIGGYERVTLLLTDRDRAVVQLLQRRLTDQAIARQLGVTERTVTRRVRRLMDLTGTETRFQLGWRAAQAGWLSES